LRLKCCRCFPCLWFPVFDTWLFPIHPQRFDLIFTLEHQEMLPIDFKKHRILSLVGNRTTKVFTNNAMPSTTERVVCVKFFFQCCGNIFINFII
jgi:hypothetical protein